MKLEDYKSGELITELLQRKDVELTFIEPHESIELSVDCVDDSAIILVYRNQIRE